MTPRHLLYGEIQNYRHSSLHVHRISLYRLWIQDHGICCKYHVSRYESLFRVHLEKEGKIHD